MIRNSSKNQSRIESECYGEAVSRPLTDAVLRHLVLHPLRQDPNIDVLPTAPNGAVALSPVAQLNPDVISLDLELPEIDRLETWRRVMFSSHTERGAAGTVEVLTLAADDYVTKVNATVSVIRFVVCTSAASNCSRSQRDSTSFAVVIQ